MRNRRMANGILKQLNQSLEITVQDSLDGLADFTLQLAYASSGVQFEILSADDLPSDKNDSPVKPTTLTLVDTSNSNTQPRLAKLRQRHA